MESIHLAVLDEAEWEADEVSFCTTTNSTMSAHITDEIESTVLDEAEWEADEVSFCTTTNSTMSAQVVTD